MEATRFILRAAKWSIFKQLKLQRHNSNLSRKAEKCLHSLEKFYAQMFGEDWLEIEKAMKQKKQQCALVNSLLPDAKNICESLISMDAFELTPHTMSKDKNNWKESLRIFKMKTGHFKPPQIDTEHSKLAYYLMDLSSLMPVLALDVQSSDFILDMCAAPGGKSLAIAMQMLENGQLVSNELNPGRKKRLFKVLNEYLQRQGNIKVTGINGILFGETEPKTFDKILLDAPCSADRHLIHDNFQHSGWSVKKSRDYAKLQKQLLLSALAAVKVDGTVLYSTCTLSPFENDGVIEAARREALENFGIRTDITDLSRLQSCFGLDEFYFSETAKHGVLILPYQLRNWGPIYSCKLTRVS